jgi:hypothetical protein
MTIKEYAIKEMRRMKEVFSKLKITSDDKKAKEFYDFAHNYFKDGQYFFKEEKYPESFEAFIIAWAYIDIGLKLRFYHVPKDQENFFTA